jgi:hypothetical protein
MVSYYTADSKPVKQEVNGTVILPPLVFPGYSLTTDMTEYKAISITQQLTTFLKCCVQWPVL